MEQFDLSVWIKDKSRKLVTRDGRPARVICWDRKSLPNRLPIIVLEEWNDTECVSFVSNYGRADLSGMNNPHDIFFADEGNTELTEFEKAVEKTIPYKIPIDTLKSTSQQLLDIARKEIEAEKSEFKPKFTYNEKDYSELANKLIEFRNNTPLCSVSYRGGDGREIILHYEKEILDLARKEILKDFPKWKDSWSTDDNTKPQIIGGCLVVGDNLIHISDLVDKLPKEE